MFKKVFWTCSSSSVHRCHRFDLTCTESRWQNKNLKKKNSKNHLQYLRHFFLQRHAISIIFFLYRGSLSFNVNFTLHSLFFSLLVGLFKSFYLYFPLYTSILQEKNIQISDWYNGFVFKLFSLSVKKLKKVFVYVCDN